jgi:hypothetical protein
VSSHGMLWCVAWTMEVDGASRLVG